MFRSVSSNSDQSLDLFNIQCVYIHIGLYIEQILMIRSCFDSILPMLRAVALALLVGEEGVFKSSEVFDNQRKCVKCSFQHHKNTQFFIKIFSFFSSAKICLLFHHQKHFHCLHYLTQSKILFLVYHRQIWKKWFFWSGMKAYCGERIQLCLIIVVLKYVLKSYHTFTDSFSDKVL